MKYLYVLTTITITLLSYINIVNATHPTGGGGIADQSIESPLVNNVIHHTQLPPASSPEACTGTGVIQGHKHLKPENYTGLAYTDHFGSYLNISFKWTGDIPKLTETRFQEGTNPELCHPANQYHSVPIGYTTNNKGHTSQLALYNLTHRESESRTHSRENTPSARLKFVNRCYSFEHQHDKWSDPNRQLRNANPYLTNHYYSDSNININSDRMRYRKTSKLGSNLGTNRGLYPQYCHLKIIQHKLNHEPIPVNNNPPDNRGGPNN